MTRILGAFAVALLASCSAPPRPRPPAPSAHVAPPPALAKYAITVIGVSTYATQLFYAQPGRAVVANSGMLALVDTMQLERVGTPKRLSSDVAEDHVDPINHRISRDVESAMWTWDRGELLGVVLVGGLGGADPSGLGVWRPATQTIPAYMPGVRGYNCRPAAISPDHALLATIGCNAQKLDQPALQLFAADTRAPVATASEDAVRAVFSADSTKIAFSTKDNTIGVYDISAHHVTMLPKVHKELVLGLAFDPKRPVLVTADGDFAVYAWDLARETRTRIGEQGSLAAYSPDGRYLALAHRDQVVILDAASLHRAFPPLKIKFSWGPDGLAWAPDSHQLAIASGGDTVTVVDLAPGEVAAGPASGADVDSAWSRLHRLPAPAPGVPPPILRDGVVEGSITLAGAPVAGAEIRLVPHEQEWPDARALTGPTAKTGKDGTFYLDHVPQIEWNARVEATGTTVSGFVADLRHEPSVKVQLRVEAAVTIRGRVVGPDGRPAKDVRVVHYHYDGTVDTDQKTDAGGAFTIDHLRPVEAGPSQNFDVVFRRGDGAVRTVRFDIGKPGPRTAPVTLLRATDPHVVRVHVVDKTGAPIAGAELIVNEMNGVPTDAAGDASLDVMDLKRVPVRVRGLGGGSDQTLVDLPQRTPLVITIGG